MKVIVGSMAWLPKNELNQAQQGQLKSALTVQPRKVGDFPGDPPPPLKLYRETDELFGMPRSFFMERRKDHHDLDFRVSSGDKSQWPGDLVFSGSLRAEQQEALELIKNRFLSQPCDGGMIMAAPGWGKTVHACSLIKELQVPTLVVVHKEFLMKQWAERISTFLPNARVGVVQGPVCDFKDKHIVLGMVHSLSSHNYSDEFIRWPGLLLIDECHRIGAATWAEVPTRFPAKYRLGVSGTIRRKDGAERVFYDHLGPILFRAKEQRMAPQIRRVWTEFRLVSTATFNPGLLSKAMVLKFLCASPSRNKLIVDQLILAAKAGRKILVLSERLKHLHALEELVRKAWHGTEVPLPTMGYYVGGMTEESLDVAADCQIIFATSQFAAEGLDIPPLDTLILASPMSDVEQAVGRILRPAEGKKDPIVVDIIDPLVALTKRSSDYREALYAKQGWSRPA